MRKEKAYQLLRELAGYVEKKGGYINPDIESFRRNKSNNNVLLRVILVVEQTLSTEVLIELANGNEVAGKVLVQSTQESLDGKEMIAKAERFENISELFVQVEKQMEKEKLKAIFSGAGLYFLERICNEASQAARQAKRWMNRDAFIQTLKEIYEIETMAEVEILSANLLPRAGADYGINHLDQLKLINIETQEWIWLTNEKWLYI